MDLLKRVWSNVYSAIVPNSYKENGKGRKRGAENYDPELTDDEELAGELPLHVLRKRMRPTLDGPSTSAAARAMLEKPFGSVSGKETKIPILLENNQSSESLKRTGAVDVNGSSGPISSSRRSMFDFSGGSRGPGRLSKIDWHLSQLKPNLKVSMKPRSVFDQMKKNNRYHAPATTSTRHDTIRLGERDQYVRLLQNMFSSGPSKFFPRSSKPSTSDDSGRSSQIGLKPLSTTKIPEHELKARWMNGSTRVEFSPMFDTPSKMQSLNFSGGDSLLSCPGSGKRGSEESKAIETIDISREDDSDDSVICESPASFSTPKLTAIRKSPLQAFTSPKDIPLDQRIREVLDRSFGDIERPIVLDDDTETESTPNSSEKENDDEIQVLSPPSIKFLPMNSNSLELDLQASPFSKPSWLSEGKSCFSESRRERQEKIKLEEKKLEILRSESTLDKDMSEIVRRNLTLTDIIELVQPEEELKLPEITEEMLDVINLARCGRNPNEVLTTTPNNIEIVRADIRSLAPLQWLNDNVINSYMDMIALRSKSHDKWPKVYAFTTFFYPKFLNEGYSNILKRWTRKVDIFSYDLLIFPIHLGIHWCLAAADMRKKVIRYYDSLGGKNYQCPKALLQYLCKEHQERKKSSLGDHEWLTEIVEDIPQQQNGSDCGMFACKFAEYLSRDAELNFKQEDMNYYRERMIYEILTQDLLYP